MPESSLEAKRLLGLRHAQGGGKGTSEEGVALEAAKLSKKLEDYPCWRQ